MSANIPIGKLKFSVFGHGYDDVRGNSGVGTVNEEIDMKIYNATIDSTGAYVWATVSLEDEYHTVHNKLVKLSTSDWQEVEQTTIPDDCTFIIHPCNVSNNYGFAINVDGTEVYIFDLTEDTLIATISGEYGVTIGYRDWESILIEDKIYVIDRNSGNTTNRLWVFDITNETFDDSAAINGVGCNGFINGSSLYACYTREWGYQTSTAYAINFSGNVIWTNTGINRNDYIVQWGLTGNGYLYLPVLSDGKWHFGMFDGTSNPTFSPVSPIRMFGEYDSAPSLYLGGNNRNLYITYSDGKIKGCVLTTIGVIFTDFTDAIIISDELVVPIAMNDDMVLCSDYDHNKLYVIGL